MRKKILEILCTFTRTVAREVFYHWLTLKKVILHNRRTRKTAKKHKDLLSSTIVGPKSKVLEIFVLLAW
jgi:hypothetical protein